MEKVACYKIKIGVSGTISNIEECPRGMRSKKFPCIYAFIYKNKIIRVGEGSQGYSRIRSGLNQPLTKIKKGNKKATQNYYAYRWRVKYKNRTLNLVLFKIKQPNLKTNYAIQKWRRSVEAEITYELRQTSGHWPTSMNEIHFDESYRNRKNVQEEVDSFFQYFKLVRANK